MDVPSTSHLNVLDRQLTDTRNHAQDDTAESKATFTDAEKFVLGLAEKSDDREYLARF